MGTASIRVERVAALSQRDRLLPLQAPRRGTVSDLSSGQSRFDRTPNRVQPPPTTLAVAGGGRLSEQHCYAAPSLHAVEFGLRTLFRGVSDGRGRTGVARG